METQMELFKNLKNDNKLSEIQEYLAKVLHIRGFSDESVQDALLWLAEELGELIKAVRKCSSNSFIDPTHAADYKNVEEELADVFILGEGNGNPLQCSCLENSRDGGPWWAAVYGVAQSQTQLKRLSRSKHK